MTHGQQVARRAAVRARASAPKLAISEIVRPGGAGAELVSRSIECRLLVVGCRGLGAFGGLWLGSVSQQVAAHARCPVVVVRGPSRPVLPADAPVTVGVDWSGSDVVLGFAFDYAARHHRPVAAVHAHRPPPADQRIHPPLPPVSYQRAATELLGEAVSPWREKFPGPRVDLLALDARPVDALVDESRRSVLLALGSRGQGGFAGLLLGSVSQHVLRHADCPVAVIRH
jgi:nucleotide-binding universal stress UspA family protein